MKSVMILEDNDIYVNRLKALIEEIDANIKIFIANNLQQAYGICGQNNIDLMLVDIILDSKDSSDISGLEFAKNIRETQRYEFTPIIFVTCLEDPEIASYKELRCFGYIEKPFEKGTVQALIKKALKFPANNKNNNSISFRIDGIMYIVKCKNIVCAKKEGRRINVISKKEEFNIPYWSIDKFLQKTQGGSIIRVSKYAVINMEHIESVDFANRYIKLKYMEELVEIGITMKKQVKNEISKYFNVD